MYVSKQALERVKNIIYSHQGMTQTEIAYALKMSSSCVYFATTRLLSARLIERRKDRKERGYYSTFVYYPIRESDDSKVG